MRSWPPAYFHRRSKRARHIRFTFTAENGLEIITPTHFNVQMLPELLNKNRTWIEKHWQEPAPKKLPTEFHLQAIHQIWQIHYHIGSQLAVRLSNSKSEKTLVLQGPDKAQHYWQPLLHEWFKRIARHYLGKQLGELSLQTGWTFKSLAIRKQKTRWGSCSKQKRISLNYHLLFLPPHLVRYVLLHELAHTQRLDHSERFWQLLAQHDPLYQKHRKELRAIALNLPRI